MILEKSINYFKNLSFKRKLFISYLIVVIIPIISLGLFAYFKSREYLQDQFLMGMKETIYQVSINTNDKLKKQDDFIKFLSFNPELNEVLRNKDIDPFTLAQKLNNNIESIIWYYLSINMEIKELKIYSENRTTDIGSFIEPSSKIKDEYWYKESKSNSSYWWYKGNELFTTHIILNKDNNKIVGLLYLKLNTDEILADIQSDKFKKYGYIVTNNAGNIITYKDSSNINNDIKRKIIINSSKENVMVDNKAFLVIKNQISTSNWTLYYYVPEENATVNSSEILKATAAIIFACGILLVLIIWMFSRTFVSRINNLNKKIEIVENGDLGIEISSQSKDEIGDLTNKFGNMLKKINILINEVYQGQLDKKEALLKALQAQINPHFLYNSLSMINWKAINAGDKEISNITKLLSKFYRTTLNKGKTIISVRDEIENIKAYIDLQLMMHNNEFEVIYDIDEEILGYEMINFILQPIVENAIAHGIDEKLDGEGVLKISCFLENNCIEFAVSDNGEGINNDLINDLLEKDTSGYGLKNINERLVLYFGPEYRILIDSEIGKGTIVKVKIPKNIILN